MKPIERTVPWLPWGALGLTLWPFIFYRDDGNRVVRPGTIIHEHYHWHDILRHGIVFWYLAYFLLQFAYFRKPAHLHPLEKPAYIAQWRSEGWTEEQITNAFKPYEHK